MDVTLFSSQIIFHLFVFICAEHIDITYEKKVVKEQDHLHPYGSHAVHGSQYDHPQLVKRLPRQHAESANETIAADNDSHEVPVVSRGFLISSDSGGVKKYTYGKLFHIANPGKLLSVLEPGGNGGCRKHSRETVSSTSRKADCVLAINGGFFNTSSGACLGNVVSDGWAAFSTHGIQNVHFGVQRDGRLFIGYLPEHVDLAGTFSQLVGGVIWIVRDGAPYISESELLEYSQTQTTGSLHYFTQVRSARTAIGYDRHGKVVVAVVEGKTGDRGATLAEVADHLISWGAVNAINLDGGGSSTLVVNDTLVNYPGDICHEQTGKYNSPDFHCERQVSTVICIRVPSCQPEDCGGHGICRQGACQCVEPWTGPSCTVLHCDKSCGVNGVCEETGCTCLPGWRGKSCSLECPPGWHGRNCSERCLCLNGASCSPFSGLCTCSAGHRGLHCEELCQMGTFGPGCGENCSCTDGCGCHHVNGSCDLNSLPNSALQVGRCLMDHVLEKRSYVTEQSVREWSLLCILLGVALFAFLSFSVNIVVLVRRCLASSSAQRNAKRPKGTSTFIGPASSEADVDTDTDNELFMYPVTVGDSQMVKPLMRN